MRRAILLLALLFSVGCGDDLPDCRRKGQECQKGETCAWHPGTLMTAGIWQCEYPDVPHVPQQ